MNDPSMKYAALDKLNDLRVKGVLSDAEFTFEKEKLLNDNYGETSYQDQEPRY